METIPETPEKQLSQDSHRKESFFTPPPKSITPGPNAFAANRQVLEPTLCQWEAQPAASTLAWPLQSGFPDFASQGQHGLGISSGQQSNKSKSTKTRRGATHNRRGSQKLKLVPSPNPEVQVQPTHRAQVEAKREERLLNVLRNAGSTSESKSQIATVHNQPRPSAPSAPSKIDHIQLESKELPPEPTSPKRKFLNKLGIGTPTLKSSTQSPTFSVEPTKVDTTPIKEVPSKAAKVLGTLPMATADRPAGSNNQRFSDEESFPRVGGRPTSIDTARSSAVALPKLRISDQSKTSDSSKGSSSPVITVHNPRQRMREINERLASIGSSHSGRFSETPNPGLKFFDNDVPPTPPSKPSITGKPNPTDGEATPIRFAGQDENAKVGQAGFKGHLNVVENTQRMRSQYGELDHADDRRQSSATFADVVRNGNTGTGPQSTPTATSKSGNGVLPQTVYSPSLYHDSGYTTTDSTHPADNTFTGHSFGKNSDESVSSDAQLHIVLEVDRDKLHPPPLAVSSYIRPHHGSSDDDSQRNASESTTWSVPVYLEVTRGPETFPSSAPQTLPEDLSTGTRQHCGNENSISARPLYETLTTVQGNNYGGGPGCGHGPTAEQTNLDHIMRGFAGVHDQLAHNFNFLHQSIVTRVGEAETSSCRDLSEVKLALKELKGSVDKAHRDQQSIEAMVKTMMEDLTHMHGGINSSFHSLTQQYQMMQEMMRSQEGIMHAQEGIRQSVETLRGQHGRRSTEPGVAFSPQDARLYESRSQRQTEYQGQAQSSPSRAPTGRAFNGGFPQGPMDPAEYGMRADDGLAHVTNYVTNNGYNSSPRRAYQQNSYFDNIGYGLGFGDSPSTRGQGRHG